MKVEPKTTLTWNVTITIDESEARALDALAGYGTDEFIKTFYEKMGKSYLQPHEKGLQRLFASIRKQICPALGEIDEVRKTIKQNREKALKELRERE